MESLINQLKARRIALGLKQHDMLLRVGMSRQQYQRLEAGGNPRLNTLELLAEGLKGELLLIPREELAAVRALLEGQNLESQSIESSSHNPASHPIDDPWKDFLGDLRDE